MFPPSSRSSLFFPAMRLVGQCSFCTGLLRCVAMWGIVFTLAAMPGALGLQVTGYSPTLHDRFTSGFPSAPVPNAQADFVGKNLDWSAMGWSLEAAGGGTHKGLALLSPRHFLTVAHYETSIHELTTGIRLLDREGVFRSHSGVSRVDNLDFGLLLTNYGVTAYDLALGRLTAAAVTPSHIARFPLLDLYASSSSTTMTNYLGLPVLHYGRGNSLSESPRVASSTVDGIDTIGGDTKQLAVRTSRTGVQLEVGDSGSPLFAVWTSPQGAKELAILGANSAVDASFNYMSFLAHPQPMTTTANLMAADGYALRLVGVPNHTWQGVSSKDIATRAAWGVTAPANPPSDVYVNFNAAIAGNGHQVNMNANRTLRGLYFWETLATQDGFQFGGSGTLSLGRGGLTNYDADRQTFAAPMALLAHQFWSTGSGGVAVGALNLNQFLLEITGQGASVLSGAISGSGGLALSGGDLEISATASYTGATWVHEGTLRITGNIASSAGVNVGVAGVLRGQGRVSSVSGGGVLSPGPGPRVLRASALNAAEGLGLDFVFTTSTANLASPSASGNSVVWLSAATPFTAPLGGSNRVRLFLPSASVGPSVEYRGGFFVEASADFAEQVRHANWEVYVPDAAGAVWQDGVRYSRYVGDWPLVVTTESHTVEIDGALVDGRLAVFGFRPITFTEWVERTLPEALPEEQKQPLEDPTGQNIPNVLAYALGVNPFVESFSSAGVLPAVTVENAEMVFRFRRNLLAGEAIYEVETSSDLEIWTAWTGDLQVEQADADGDGLVQILGARIPWPSDGQRLFARLRVRLP